MNREPKSKINIGEVLRERGKLSETDISEIWEKHESDRLERIALQNEYRKTKAQAKKLKKEFLEYDERESLFQKYTKYKKKITEAITPSIKTASVKLKDLKLKRKVPVFVVLIILLAVLYSITSVNKNKHSDTSLLGANSEEVDTTALNGNVKTSDSLPEVKDFEFDLVTPKGSSLEDIKVFKISPPGNDTVYSYNDELSGAILQLSQQQLPEDFLNNRVSRLQEVATSFQALSVIELDGNKIYHGYSEENSGVQSLIFLKNNLLVFIKSSEKLSDEMWVNYISGLKITP